MRKGLVVKSAEADLHRELALETQPYDLVSVHVPGQTLEL